MSTWNGPHHKGAMRTLRQFKREEAEARNALTPPGRRSRKRHGGDPAGPADDPSGRPPLAPERAR